jgi:hypothetical protein
MGMPEYFVDLPLAKRNPSGSARNDCSLSICQLYDRVFEG